MDKPENLQKKWSKETLSKRFAQKKETKYDYYFPLEDPESLLLIDRWKDEEAIEKHHKSEMMAQINELRKSIN